MISKRLAAILLILGPIITLIAAFTGPIGPDIDWGNTTAVLGALSQANTGMAKLSFLVLDIGLLMSVLGFRYFIVGMNTNEKVSNYSTIGGTLLIIGITIVLGEQFLYAAAAEAAAMAGGAGMGTAAAMWAGGQALGSGGTAVLMAGYALVGIAAFLSGAFNKILAILLVIVGIIGVAGPVSGNYTEPVIMIVPYVGGAILTIAIGIFTLRSK
tara:strand:- start:475 stop:1113 length:639 start_codon:yes stop_codon:yes gene_type:complete